MKSHPISADHVFEDRVLDFPVTIERRLAMARTRRHGLMNLSLPAPLRAWSGAVLLAGENLLLPAIDEGAPRYGCCIYLTDVKSGATLAVAGCRTWSRPPLDPRDGGHAVWDELEAGLFEAVARLGEAYEDLDQAIAAGRTWLGEGRGKGAPVGGSAVLGEGDPILCPAEPGDRGPAGGALYVVPKLRQIILTTALTSRAA